MNIKKWRKRGWEEIGNHGINKENENIIQFNVSGEYGKLMYLLFCNLENAKEAMEPWKTLTSLVKKGYCWCNQRIIMKTLGLSNSNNPHLLSIRPVLWTDQMIEAHIWLCPGTELIQIMRKKLNDNDVRVSPKYVPEFTRHHFNQIDYSKNKRFYKVSSVKKNTKKIATILNVKLKI